LTRSRDNATNVAGDISGVTAGTGLTGGGTGGTVTLDLTTPVASTNGGTGLSSFTTGDMIYSSSGNTLAKLGIGAASQVLTVASGIPSWANAASGGGMTLIQEQTASANSSLSFSSIPGTHKQLLLVWSGIYHSALGSTFVIRFNNDSSTQYRGNGISGLGTTVIARSMNEVSVILGAAVNLAPFGVSANLTTTDFNTAAVGTLLVDNYASTTKVKTFFTQFGYYDNSAGHYSSGQINGTFNNITPITSIDIVRLTGAATFTNITNSSIRLYGIS